MTSYPKRSRTPEENRRSARSSNRVASNSGRDQSRAFLGVPDPKGKAQRALQATGAERREAQLARIGEFYPPRREPSP
ncbi:hypothetical protein F2Q68_00020627 [Brassica cretica]|uniref:Uncharacterized protein n=2 Tax=Brassica cretica TaxID=69181 RepID=A0ABQ7D237_BRACR|nr:hypothetical protein F2Q68_00020627 [Brassica cretica]KAF3565533.1 hypothetical protein DY000_02014371 [Brassica cretica]